MSIRAKRGLIMIGLVLLPFIVGLLVTYEIVQIDFPTDMEEQLSVDYSESPIILPPSGSVPIQGQPLVLDKVPANPVRSDEVSIQRGNILYSFHCLLCHGEGGNGDGPIAEYYPDQQTRDLTTSSVDAQFDGLLFRTISDGLGQMPALAENLTPRERWDVINYLRSMEGIKK